MAVLNLGAVLGLGLPVLLLHLFSVTLTRALRTYSRSGLEAVCARRGRPDRADAIAHDDERTERAAEALAVLTGLLLAAFLGASSNRRALGPAVGTVVTIALSLGGIGYVLAGLLGRVHAEKILDSLWPILGTLRMFMTPLTFLSRSLEESAYRRAGRSIHGSSPRPPSVEVEIHSAGETSAELEADLPDSTRSMLERVVELGRMSVSDLMIPGSSIASLPADVSALEAARAFRETGFSRIPLFGAHRDDIVGVLYAKDLFPTLIDAKDSGSVQPKKLARPPFFVPETKDAADLLIEFRARRVQLAIALDEYGGVAGLISLEDLLEQVVGPIDDEHDRPASAEPIVPLGNARFEVDALVELEEVNERLGLHLPTDGDFSTVGGFAFNSLGRLPEPGDSFRHNGAEFIVLEVAEHSIRRLRVELDPQAVAGEMRN
ncbi:MAG: hypothetical protein NVSMB14_10810 [Isosphaeraceae bacterium]